MKTKFFKVAAERERTDRTNCETQIKDKNREIADLQQRYLIALFLNNSILLTNICLFRLQDLSQLNERLRSQLNEKDDKITSLTYANQSTVSLKENYFSSLL